jgi:hypothetical protein
VILAQPLDDHAWLPVPIDLVTEVHAFIQQRLGGPAKHPAGFVPQEREWTTEELRYFDRDDNLSLRRFRQLLDVLSERPGRANAMSRVDQATAIDVTPDQLDSVFTNVSYWLKRDFERQEPPARRIRGDDIDAALPRVSYRWMTATDAQTWRRLRKLPPVAGQS